MLRHAQLSVEVPRKGTLVAKIAAVLQKNDMQSDMDHVSSDEGNSYEWQSEH
jgi:hypothetical protein